MIALLLITATQFLIQLGALFPHFFRSGLGLFGKVRFTAIDVVEAARHFTGQFHMHDLILTHRNLGGAIDQDVGTLQQGITQKAIGGEVFFLEFFLLVLVGRHPFQPAQRGDHRQQQVQFGVLRHL